MRRLGAPENHILGVQNNLANTYEELGKNEDAIGTRWEVYTGFLKHKGIEDRDTLMVASNYTNSLIKLKRFEEAKVLLRKTVPVAQRVLGKEDPLTIKLRWRCAEALYKDDGATLDELREVMTTLDDAERIARRVLGNLHPTTEGMRRDVQVVRAALAARESGTS